MFLFSLLLIGVCLRNKTIMNPPHTQLNSYMRPRRWSALLGILLQERGQI